MIGEIEDTHQENTNAERQGNHSGTGQPSKKKRTSRPLFSTVMQPTRSTSEGPCKIIEELNQYLSEPVVATEDDSIQILSFSPLRDYWKLNSHRFTFLSQIAKDIFGIPASSGNIERIFSTALDIIGAKRHNLKPDLFERFLIMKRNSHLTK